MTQADVAAELLAARTEQAISLAEASCFTKIQPDHLSRIEQGDFSFLPTAYMVPMVCKYAEGLGIPNDRISTYRRVIAAPTKPAAPASDEPADLVRSVHGGSVAARERRTKELYTVSPVGLISALSMTVVAVAVFLGLTLFASRTNEMPAVVVRTETPTTARPHSSAPTTAVSPAPKPALPPPTVGNVVQKPLRDSASATAAANAPQKRLSLVVKTKAEPCWVNVIADKKNSREAYLPPNQIQTFEADSLFTLTLGRVQAAEVWLNGKTIALPRGSSSVSTIRLSQKDL